MDVDKWLLDWLLLNTNVCEDDYISSQYDNFLENKLINSFEFFRLITYAEDSLGIRFDDKDFSDPRILTFDGVKFIINKRVLDENMA
jgi:acyl carrier protein